MGCVQSKSIDISKPNANNAVAAETTETLVKSTNNMAPIVAVVYYSTYGHIKKMADTVAAGLKESGIEAKLYQVPETLSEEVSVHI